MKKTLLVIVAIVIIGAIGFGGYKAYGMAYTLGEDKGYDSGYTAGEGAGYLSGQEVGYTLGKTEGFQSGKEQGYAEGYNDGAVDGYADGEADGYEDGISDGLGHGYTIKDPTFAQVLAFLAADKTDTKPYLEDSYVCSHYSRDVCNNAEAAGIRCAVVELRYRSTNGHMVVAFNTIDSGMLYFEPQSDERCEPAIGKRYYQTIIPEPGFFYEAPEYDDTIEDMVIIW
jgi:hypothetical protein